MEFKQKLATSLFAALLLLTPSLSLAHQPVLEPAVQPENSGQSLYYRAVKLGDPTKASLANYGSLSEPGEVDVYAFTTEQASEVPVELLVPVRPGNKNFKPSLVVIAKNLENGASIPKNFLNLDIPEGYQMMELINDHNLGIFDEPFAQERYWRGQETKLQVVPKANYFLVISDSQKQTGDYSLGVGTVEDFTNANFLHLLQNVFMIKLALVGSTTVPWIDILGLFILLAGLIVGLGAVTVIDTLGFLGRKSSYWTESTIRAHKVTKPLIWLGIILFSAGMVITYRESWLTGVALFQVIITILLVLNGLFLSFYVSPKLLKQEHEGEISKILPKSLQTKITLSFVISFLGWWTNLFLTVWYLVMMR